MSGDKRSLIAEDDSAVTGDVNETPTSPFNAPDSKKLRRSTSYSENDAETQIVEQDDGMTNGHSSSQSETEEEEDDEQDDVLDDENEVDNFSNWKIIQADFDNGNENMFRYDGSVALHIHLPSRTRFTRITSEPSIIRTCSWRLISRSSVIHHTYHGDNIGAIGLFLECQPGKSSQGWSIFAKAELTLVHATDATKNYTRKIDHLFNARSTDWGFNEFKPWKEIYSDFLHLPDNTIRLEAKIHADPPRNVDWDSKGQTGFIGLRNIGATCYMNSFLQTIYFTRKLRKAVYTLPTDSDNPERSIPLALQKIFYDLQFTDKPVSTKKLTRSFGWDQPDEFCQHDIQEFCRVLLDKLESKMEGTTMEGIIPSLFQGQYVQYIRCTKVDHESRVKQTFYDVPLQVRNSANITESFRDFCKSEVLTGENLYDAGSIHGLQEAEKGVKFQKFPPVLCLHLLRFEYDYNLSQHRKINDSYSFDYRLDLSEFLEKPGCSSCSYKLLSILVHSGDNSSGHYVSFINPNLDEQWLKFDDDVVGRVASSDAMDRNFGGVHEDDGSMYNTSAYMLVYIREDCQKDVLCNVNREDIPENLVKRFEYDRKYFPKRRQNKFDSVDQIDIKVILNDDFFIQQAACLTDLLYDNSMDLSQCKCCTRYVQAQKSESFGVFSRRMAYEMGVDLNRDIRIWIVKTHEILPHHPNHYHGPGLLTSLLVYCDDYERKIMDLFENEISDRNVTAIFVEQKAFLNGFYELSPFTKDDDLLIFVRVYRSENESLVYIGHFLFSQHQTLHKCLRDIAMRAEIPTSPSTTYLVHQAVPKLNHITQYESVKSTNFDLPLHRALAPCLSGTSLIMQLLDVDRVNSTQTLTTVDDFFQNVAQRHEFDVCNRDHARNETLFKLYLPWKTTIVEVIRFIAERIAYPQERIMILRVSASAAIANSMSPVYSLHMGSDQILGDLYSNTRLAVTTPRRIYFRRLPFHYTELAHRRLFPIYLTNPRKLDEQREVQLYARKSSAVAEFLQEIKQWIPALCSQTDHEQFRMIELSLCTQVNSPFRLRICPDDSRMDELLTSATYYCLEKVSDADIDGNADTVLIPVAHYNKEHLIQVSLQNFFPFFLHVIHNESFADVKQRLQRRLRLTLRELEKYRFSIFNGTKLVSRCDDDMGRINLRELRSFQRTCWLGLELPTVFNPRKTRKSLFSEKPIRIN